MHKVNGIHIHTMLKNGEKTSEFRQGPRILATAHARAHKLRISISTTINHVEDRVEHIKHD